LSVNLRRPYNPTQINKMSEHEHVGLLTDEAVLHNIAHGCEDCFDLLFLRFFRPIRSLAFKILRDRSEAEDVVQDVFFKIHEQREHFDPSIGSARTWILQFGYYRALKRRAYRWKHQFYGANTSSDSCDPVLVQPEFIQKSLEQRECVELGLAGLKPAQRQVIELVHFEGHTLREISEMEGKELGTIRNNYYRGLKALKTILDEGIRPDQVQLSGQTKKREKYEIEL